MNDIKTYLKILEILRKKHISQKYLAEKIKIKPSSLSRMLSGKYKVKLENLEKIANVLEMPVSFFLDSNDNMYDRKQTDNFHQINENFSLYKEVDSIKKEIDFLKKENALLKKETLKLKSKLKK
ncbi:MAG: helix-turn-helix transcriptional regulator [Endomicrobiaceae bacterium]